MNVELVVKGRDASVGEGDRVVEVQEVLQMDDPVGL